MHAFARVCMLVVVASACATAEQVTGSNMKEFRGKQALRQYVVPATMVTSRRRQLLQGGQGGQQQQGQGGQQQQGQGGQQQQGQGGQQQQGQGGQMQQGQGGQMQQGQGGQMQQGQGGQSLPQLPNMCNCAGGVAAPPPLCPADGATHCIRCFAGFRLNANGTQCISTRPSSPPPAPVTRTAGMQSNFNSMRSGPSGSFNPSLLNGTARAEVLRSMSLRSGERMQLNCSADAAGCTLCQSGCNLQDGATVSMAAGTVRLPANANAGWMNVDLARGATLRVEGGSRSLSGEMKGTLDIRGGGTVWLTNMTGGANLAVDSNSSMVWQGNGKDQNASVVSKGTMRFGGKATFRGKISSLGHMSVDAGAALRFEGKKHFSRCRVFWQLPTR
jgi:hypothetical protein